MNASEYRIFEVDEIPGGGENEWLLLDMPDAVAFVVKRGSLTAQVIADGWSAYRKIMHERSEPSSPQRRWLYAVG